MLLFCVSNCYGFCWAIIIQSAVGGEGNWEVEVSKRQTLQLNCDLNYGNMRTPAFI